MSDSENLKIKPKEKVEKTIGATLGLKYPPAWKSGQAVPLPNPSPQLLYGLELEIENIPDERDPVIPAGISVTEDGSLRSSPGTYAREFITQPMTYSCIALVLNELFARNRFNENNYSERCSIHVHTNVHDLTYEQLASLFLVYQVYERVLFNWIGHDRARNIFCVPWYDTTMTYKMITRIAKKDSYSFSEWQKYTALNMLPIREQCSIEWRHMDGHCNLPRILTWLRLIGHIYKFATEVPLEDVKRIFTMLNTTSQYTSSINQVFGDDAAHLRTDGFEKYVEDGVLAMKYSLMEETAKTSAKKTFYQAIIDGDFDNQATENTWVELDEQANLNRLNLNVPAGATVPQERLFRDDRWFEFAAMPQNNRVADRIDQLRAQLRQRPQVNPAPAPGLVAIVDDMEETN